MFIGLDIHKAFIHVVKIKNAGAPVKESFQFPTTVEEITKFAGTLKPKDQVVLESTLHSVPIAKILGQSGAKIVISNPIKTKMIANSRIKSDKVDAEVLARLLASDFIPTVWLPTPEITEIRKLTVFSDIVTSQRTIVKNKIHSVLHRNLISYGHLPNLFNSVGRKFLDEVQLPEDEVFQLKIELQILDYLDKQINIIKERIARKVITDEDCKRIMTIPGIDFYSALSIKAVIGDITRFGNQWKLVSYMGLNPRMYQSGNSCYIGKITKSGSRHARWVLVQAANQIAKTPGPLRAFFLRVKRRSHRNTAIVAVASKLTRIIWFMLTRKTDFRFAHPLRTKEKMAKLRIVATGVRLGFSKKKGAPKGAGRQEYLLARVHDHDNAIQGQKEYEEFVESRVGTKQVKVNALLINPVVQEIPTEPKVKSLVSSK